MIPHWVIKPQSHTYTAQRCQRIPRPVPQSCRPHSGTVPHPELRLQVSLAGHPGHLHWDWSRHRSYSTEWWLAAFLWHDMSAQTDLPAEVLDLRVQWILLAALVREKIKRHNIILLHESSWRNKICYCILFHYFNIQKVYFKFDFSTCKRNLIEIHHHDEHDKGKMIDWLDD